MAELLHLSTKSGSSHSENADAATGGSGGKGGGGGDGKVTPETAAEKADRFANDGTQWGKVRSACLRLVSLKAFDNGILACIFISSITLSVDTPFIDPGE